MHQVPLYSSLILDFCNIKSLCIATYATIYPPCNPHPPKHKNMNSLLARGRCGSDFRSILFKLTFQNSSMGTHEIALRRMPQSLTNDKSTLAQVMTWNHEAPSHSWANVDPDLSPYGVTRPQWINMWFIMFIKTEVAIMKSPFHQRTVHVQTLIVNIITHPVIILCMYPDNERRCYNVKLSLIGWAHKQNDPCPSDPCIYRPPQQVHWGNQKFSTKTRW